MTISMFALAVVFVLAIRFAVEMLVKQFVPASDQARNYANVAGLVVAIVILHLSSKFFGF